MRALTNEDKRKVLDEIYEAWCKCPDLRLGQMIVGAISHGAHELTSGQSIRAIHLRAVFNVEDKSLAMALSRLAEVRGK